VYKRRSQTSDTGRSNTVMDAIYPGVDGLGYIGVGSGGYYLIHKNKTKGYLILK